MALNLAELRAEQSRLENPNQNNSNFLDNFVKMPENEGTVVIRLLPPNKDGKLYCVTRTHRLGQKTFHSPMNLVNGRWEGYCPIYNKYRKYWTEIDRLKKIGQLEQAESLRNEATAIKPLERYYYNCIIRYYHSPQTGIVKPTDNKVKILSIGKQLHARIIRAILGDPTLDEPELGDVTDPKSGRDLKIIKRIRKSGDMAFPNYDESKFMGESPLGTEEEIKNWMAQLHDLSSLRQVKPISEIEHELNVYLGLAQEKETQFSAKPQQTVSSNVITNDEDEAFADDEFLAALSKIKS